MKNAVVVKRKRRAGEDDYFYECEKKWEKDFNLSDHWMSHYDTAKNMERDRILPDLP